MPLVNMKDLLKKAKEDGYGVGAFNVANMEMILGAIRAAEEMKAPMILQVAEVRLPYSPLELLGPMMVAAAREAKVPVAVHLDHGKSMKVILQALKIGFTSVMIDASELPIDENIAHVREVKKLADLYGAAVEAEVGQLAGSEGDEEEHQMFYSDPKDVAKMYERTGVDAIALSIGNAHGLYRGKPQLNFRVLEEAEKRVPIPLVLHGGTGIDEADFRTCISKGIHKINIATASFMAAENAARTYSEEAERSYFLLNREMEQQVFSNVRRHIEIFGSQGKAGR